MERILLNKCKEQLIIMTQTKNTVKNKLGGWVATKLCCLAMLLARLNNLSKYVFNIKYLHGQLHWPIQNKELCGNMLIGPHTRVPPII